MTFYWLYSLPNWGLLLVLTLFFSGFGVIGFILTERFVRKWIGAPPAENNIVENFLSIIGVFYGITLGLVAVGTWNCYSSTQGYISDEAITLGALYDNVSYMPELYRTELRKEIKGITEYIIREAWPLQKEGIIPKGGTLQNLQKMLCTLKPATEMDHIIVSDSLKLFNELYRLRDNRLRNVTSGLPEEMYWVLFIGAIVNITTTWLLVAKRKSVHIITTALIGILIGSLIFLIIALDFPFRGEIISITSQPYETVYQTIMNK